MPAQPGKRRTYRELFLDELTKSSGSERKIVNNRTLKTALSWDDDRYDRIKNELVSEKFIIATHGGPGGAVGLVNVPGVKSHQHFGYSFHIPIKTKIYKKELIKHLSPLKRLGLIEYWHDRNIEAGDKWEALISENLQTADIVLLLISIDFINSNYCYDIEMETALDRDAG